MQDDTRAYLDFLAKARQAFRPFTPIDLPQFFRGRRPSIELLTDELATPGRQVAIYGERGVGKTSLALLAPFFAKFDDERFFIVRCKHDTTYESAFGELLLESGTVFVPNGLETESRKAGGVTTPIGWARGEKASRARHRAIHSAGAITSALLLRTFGDTKGLLILDEYDRVQDRQTHIRLAETLKHFSDEGSQTKIIVVGVADTLADLIREHQSLTRCLAQIKLSRMPPPELAEIVTEGEHEVGLVFHQNVKKKIIGLADGFPYYAQLLSLYCAESAGRILRNTPEASVVVTEQDYHNALNRAIITGEGTLRDDYQAAVITVKRKTEMFKHVLWGVAYSQAGEVQVRSIADNIGLLTGEKPRIEGLSNYLGPLTKADKASVLHRVRQGYYKFADPLMRAYIRLIMEEHNIVEQNGQLQFPWMR